MFKTTINTAIQQGGGLQSNNNATLSRIVSAVKSLFNKIFSYKKVLAFTLAETLIVIGIIGVVASLTIPNLNSTTADKEKITKVKKIYSQLLEAEARAVAVYGPVEEWFTDSMDDKAKITRYAERLTEFMKVSKVCNYTDGCFTKKYKFNLFGDNQDFDIDTSYAVVLSDGTTLFFGGLFDPGIFFDIDGPNKGKNSICDDIHLFWVEPEHFNLDLNYFEKYAELEAGETINTMSAYFQALELTWIIRNGNMDYLKVDSDGKCPDGKTVLTWDQQTSCK